MKMGNTYSYLEPYVYKKGDPFNPTVLEFPYNCFGSLDSEELEEAEKILGQKFPEQIRNFYQKIGVGCILKPNTVPENYKFYSANEILSPIAAANFSKGILEWDNQHSWMAESTYEDLEPGDLPFFEIGDSSSFLIMKLYSDNPNAVWSGNIKIEDSFEKFIWRLYYESPSFYGDLIENHYRNLYHQDPENYSYLKEYYADLR